MTTKRQPGWRELFLILAVLPCCRSLQVSIPEPEYEVTTGGDITMTCSFTPARPITDKFVLTWEAYPDTDDDPMKSVASYFINTPVDIAPSYEGRASMEVNIEQRVSTLRLTKVTIQDSRNYQCSVLIPNDDEGTPAATTSLLVLVPPSPPICSLQGKAEYFHNITLTCKSQEGSPLPAYDWKSYSVQNTPRQFPPKTTSKDGALSLFNISRETSGFFLCTSTNRVGTASCNFTLTVVPSSMNIGSTAGIVIGVIAGLLVLGVVVFCFCRKKGKKDKHAEGSPAEMEFRDTPELGKPYVDVESNSQKKQVDQHEDKDIVPKSSYSVGAVEQKVDDDQYSYSSSKDKRSGKGSDYDSQRYQDDERDRYRGSRDRLDDQRDRHGGSRDRLEDERHRGSRDRLDDQRERYGGSRDRLDDRRDHYGGSRDRLDDQRDRYGGSRDRLDDRRDHYGGSRDRLDDHSDRYRGSRDNLNDRGSRDRLDYNDSQHRSRYD